MSETENEFDSFKVWHIGEHGVHASERSSVFGPKTPIALPLAVIRSHDPSVDVSPRSSEKIREFSLSLRRKTRHESPCNGNDSEKERKKSASENWNVSDFAAVRLKVRDARSAIWLSVPAIDTEMRGDASFVWIRSASARVRRLATVERAQLSLFVQLTVGVL